MSCDPYDPADWTGDAARCPRRKGRGFTLYERDNPASAEPCGCDEPDEDEDDE